MKKYVVWAVLSLVVFAILFCFTGCNREIIGTTYSFDRVIAVFPDGEIIEGDVDSWRDYAGDQIQVTIDGKTYLTHSSNVVLISE